MKPTSPTHLTLRSRLTPTLALIVAAGAWLCPRPAPSASPASQPTTAAAPSVGPIAYYVASCARCHGDIAAPYLGLDHPKRGPALKDAIDQMAAGPAAAPLDEGGLRQQTALHEAIFGKSPYVWLDPARPGSGEVLPGTTLTFESAGHSDSPTFTENRFELPHRDGTLIATRGQGVVRLPIRINPK